MQNFKWLVYALFVSFVVVSSGCQKTVLQQWPLISGFWPAEEESFPDLTSELDDEVLGQPPLPSDSPTSTEREQQEEVEQNNSDSAMFYRQMLVKNPDDPKAHHQLAILADKQSDFKTSEHHYKKSLERLPGSSDLLNDFGYSLFLQNRLNESKQYLQQALNIDPKNRRSLTNMALVLGTMGDEAAAMATLLKVHTRTVANRIMNQLFPENKLAGTTDSNIENRPSVSIEGIRSLPMRDRTLKMPLTANPNVISEETYADGNPRSPIIQIPISGSSSFPPGNSMNAGVKHSGIDQLNIQQTSFRENFASRKSGRGAFSNKRNSKPFDENINSAEAKVLNSYYRKALTLGHNVGHEGFLFPVFDNSNKR